MRLRYVKVVNRFGVEKKKQISFYTEKVFFLSEFKLFLYFCFPISVLVYIAISDLKWMKKQLPRAKRGRHSSIFILAFLNFCSSKTEKETPERFYFRYIRTHLNSMNCEEHCIFCTCNTFSIARCV